MFSHMQIWNVFPVANIQKPDKSAPYWNSIKVRENFFGSPSGPSDIEVILKSMGFTIQLIVYESSSGK